MNSERQKFLRTLFYATWSLLGLVGLVTVIGAAWSWLTLVRPVSEAPSYEDLFHQGLEFGQAETDAACLPEALRRMRDCKEWNCAYREVQFIRGCLQSASHTPQFCEEIPSQENELVGRRWRIDHCYEFRGDPQHCLDAAYQLQRYCDVRRRNSN